MNQLLAPMLLLTVMLHAVVLLEMLRVLRLGLRQRPPTTEAAPSGGAASVGLPAPENGVRIALNVQNRTQVSDESKHSLSKFRESVADIQASSSLSRRTVDH
jgi:hypothetical protein